jgi:hypothetical protein
VKAFVTWWLLGFLAVTAWTENGYVGALGGFLIWYMSVQIWPWAPCRVCDGTGRFRDWADAKFFRRCSGCGGTGREPRMFALSSRVEEN